MRLLKNKNVRSFLIIFSCFYSIYAFPEETDVNGEKVKEIIVYKIKEERLEDFLKIKDQVLKESASLDGLLSATTSKILSDEYTFADTMIWDDIGSSKKSSETFPKIPVAAKFLEMWDGPPLHHVLMTYEPDNLK